MFSERGAWIDRHTGHINAMDYLNIDVLQCSREKIRMYLLGLVSDPRPVCFRNGCELFSESAWFDFLHSFCGFRPDKRHFVGETWKQKDTYKLAEKVWWEVSYQPKKASAYAFSNTRQPLHNDNAWFSDPSDINFSVMTKQASEGGHSLFYLNEQLVADLIEEAPKLFHELTTRVVTVKKGSDESVGNRTTILTRNGSWKTSWNYYRTTRENPQVERMCDDFFSFLEKKESSKSVINLKLEDGDCIAWNDSALLHGRTAFEATRPFDRVFRQSMWNYS